MECYNAPVYPTAPINEPYCPFPVPEYDYLPPAYPYPIAPALGYKSDSGFGIALVVVVAILVIILGAVYYYPQN